MRGDGLLGFRRWACWLVQVTRGYGVVLVEEGMETALVGKWGRAKGAWT